MGTRLPPLPRDKLPPEQQADYDNFLTLAKQGFGENGEKFLYLDSEGAFIGPYPILQAAPETGKLFMKTVYSLATLPLDAAAKETAILACGGHYQAAYELYAHQKVAVKSDLLSEQQTEIIKSGQKPGDLNDKCSVAYDVAKHLCSTPGPLPQALWDKSVDAFGKQGTVALIHYTGLYAYVSIALNACDVPAPE